jgi:hypothetical protein
MIFNYELLLWYLFVNEFYKIATLYQRLKVSVLSELLLNK